MAPTVPRPAERAEEVAETAAVPQAPADRSSPGKPRRPGTKPAPEPTVEGTERLPVIADEQPARPASKPRRKPARKPAPPSTVEPAEPTADGTEQLPVVADEKQAEPARKPRRKPARPSTGDAAEPAKDTEDAETDAAGDAAEAPAPGRGARLTALARRQAVPLLAVAAVVLATVAVVAGIQDARLRGTPAAQNTALVDVGTSAEAAAQLSDAIEIVYSFDFARLDENEKAARDVITPEFADQFGRLFNEVRARAPEQRSVATATVVRSAVKEITGDRAVLLAFLDQRATRAAPDTESQQLAAAGRLVVTGERVDGRWKIAAVTIL